jgi:uncharacterized membrane protein YfcA
MPEDPWFYAAAVPAVLITGISKGGFAGGLGVVAVPLMSLVVPPLEAAGILLPILMVMDLIGLWGYRRDFDRRNLRLMLPGALIGIVLGTATAHLVQDHQIRLLVGLIAVLFVLHRWRGPEAAARRPGRLAGAFWGALSGFTSFVAHAGGPPFQVHMLPQRLDQRVYVATSVVFFWAVNLMKLARYAWLGQLAGRNLTTALVLMPLAPIGMLAGMWLLPRIRPDLGYRICYGLVQLVGARLIWDGSSGWIGA